MSACSAAKIRLFTSYTAAALREGKKEMLGLVSDLYNDLKKEANHGKSADSLVNKKNTTVSKTYTSFKCKIYQLIDSHK